MYLLSGDHRPYRCRRGPKVNLVAPWRSKSCSHISSLPVAKSLALERRIETAMRFPSGEREKVWKGCDSFTASVALPDESSHINVWFPTSPPVRYKRIPFSDAVNAAKPAVPA